MGAPKRQPLHQRLTLEWVLRALVEEGVVEKKNADALLQRASGQKEYPLLTIAKSLLRDRRPPHLPLDIHGLMQWLATVAGFRYFEVDPLLLDVKALAQILPAAYIKRLQVIPVKVETDRVLIATCEPFDLGWVTEVAGVVGKKIEVVIADPASIGLFLEELHTVRRATQDFKKEGGQGAARDFAKTIELEQLLGRVAENKEGELGSAVARIVDWLFQFAYEERATDIHIEPKMGKGLLRFRIDGRLRQVYAFEPEMLIAVINRIKLLCNMQGDEKRKPQDGRIRYKLEGGREFEMRLSTIPVQYGEKLAARLFDPKMSVRNFTELGFQDTDITKWKELIHAPHGLVLVTGPTGSGKSTTLHTSLRLIAREDVNICTIEDPIEIVNEDLNQMQVNVKTDVTFGNAIRAFLRQDPDVIMVGEIRDADAAKMAIQAALTGHLVLSSLHTNDAISAIPRLIDLGIPSHLLLATLRGVMAQRLVRRLCERCKEKIPTPLAGWRQLVGEAPIPTPTHVYSPTGCRDCKHTGYKGRLCLYEIITLNADLQDSIRNQITLEELQRATQGRYVPLPLSGAKKVETGVTSIEEVLRVIL